MFGKAPAVNLGVPGGTPTNIGSVTAPTTGYTSPTPSTSPVRISSPTATGVRNIDFTPGKPQYFGDVPGAMLPGTLPSNYNPIGNYKGPLPTDLLAQNPNLSPSILGGVQGLGYYTDRLGNRIFSPGGGLMRFAEGGEVKEEEDTFDPSSSSAQAALRRLLAAAPERTQTEVSVSPNARSVKKTTRKSVESGLGKGISMKMEEAKVSGEPSSREQLAAMSEQYKDLLRNTLTKPTLTARGPLAARRFADGGEATAPGVGMAVQKFLESKMLPLQVRTYLESVRDPRKRTEPITEKTLDQGELDKLRDLISVAERSRIAPRGVVNYDVHELQRRQTMGATPIADTDFSVFPSANLRNTLGQFTFERLPDGTLVVKDNYDYKGDVGEKSNPLIQYANEKGVDRPVSIRIPPKKKR